MTQEQYDRLVSIAKFLMGAFAAVAAFLLIQPDGTIPQWAQVALGAYLAFAAYANPAGLVRPKDRDNLETDPGL